jgi:hypothetical protein
VESLSSIVDQIKDIISGPKEKVNVLEHSEREKEGK